MPFRSNAPQANINPTFDRSEKNDSEVNIDLFNKGRAKCITAVNNDLWSRLFDAIACKKLRYVHLGTPCSSFSILQN